ncbi:molybdenum cofactor sulfurase [Solanum lycopersicum]|uniref:Molybdenum cofactor sulfurase n=1 Tax=Solanum lycopersicum TaxID=4081 RepID=MOCOS_SOLLC|nr:molybdenum cofactor sulfurase [Solanum lycopersicum]Q8LGM7.1 RecName: Full=Molybdenum cofactor sulfurase; Short=MCS; Short=MOS; Short=MoCo sulfurase; AltName: Full=Molybdenum cofactor sulfurtransferase [Solanum lycopersicum]AAL71858.1 molybdenum cofactor sulfurase [Solanum lycopersicum]
MNIESEKEQFLKEFGSYYGYANSPKNIDEIRATEFKRLNDTVYLDHAGATLYSESQMEAVFKDLNSTLYGNPHSQSTCSLATEDIVGKARQQVLSFFNASPREYSCIFTSGATAALKLVGETFPWSSNSSFMYSMENHNSVLGIREYALSKGAAAFAVDIEDTHVGESESPQSNLKLTQHHIQRRNEGGVLKEGMTGNTYNLFAFPSECNFSGRKFDPNLIKIIKEGSERILESSQYSRGCWLVLIDAAKGCATNPPNLSMFKADFVVFSFYKLFGYPTGLGALIVRKDAAKLMKKTYFSGGTVTAAIADVDFFKRREGVEEFFEDGTISFLSITAIQHGFKIINMLTTSSIFRHTTSIAAYVRNKLLALKHENGEFVCTLYGLLSSEMGPTVSFNMKRPDGTWYGYREVEKLATLAGIQLRTGCFCNPGACAKYLGLSHLDLLSNIEAGHVCWDDRDILHGKPTGAVRVSFGYMSTFEDAMKFVNFVESNFVISSFNRCALQPRSISLPIEGIAEAAARHFLTSITVYPIKSCAGFSVDQWPLTSTGLLHDREWILKSTTGEILTQKKVPEMCYISTLIDLNLGKLFVESPRCKEKLQIELKSSSLVTERDEMDIQNHRYEVTSYNNEVDIWFSRAIDRPCTLLRNSDSQSHSCINKNGSPGMCRDVGARLNFVNEAQFLLISEESIKDLNSRLKSNGRRRNGGQAVQVGVMRFRPNLVASSGEPYAEDGWSNINIGGKYFMSLGGCNRCQMININPEAGEVQRFTEPLATLAGYRRAKGKIMFGILLRYENNTKTESDTWIRVGEEIIPNGDRH